MIGISKCLCGYDCTYRGDSNRIEALELIDKKGEAVLICPEVLGGLSIPRDPAEIVSEDPLRVQTVNGKNVTKEYVEGAQKALEILIDIIINGNTVQSVLAEGEFIEMAP